MCGICGIYHSDGQPVDGALLRRMNATLTHRGPDGEGYFTDGPVGLAMRRLAIIDLSTGDQPIFNEDGSIGIVFNGEIYNYRELRELTERQGHRYRTRSDTETIVHLYEEFGTDCVKHLNGMFAFAIYDGRPTTNDERRMANDEGFRPFASLRASSSSFVVRRLFLARDHLGIKPLYYAPLDGGLIFGSELKALLAHPDCPREVDPIALDEYLALRYVPSPRTIYRGVFKLPPAHTLTWQDGTITVRRYWDVTFAPLAGRSDDEWAAELRHLLADAVQRQMIADVPLGAFLSGGVDSSIIVGLMAQSSSLPVRTFSVTFPGWPGFDESYYPRRPAHHAHVAPDASTRDRGADRRGRGRAVRWLRLVRLGRSPLADPARHQATAAPPGPVARPGAARRRHADGAACARLRDDDVRQRPVVSRTDPGTSIALRPRLARAAQGPPVAGRLPGRGSALPGRAGAEPDAGA
jgi:asparagine synthase (glutamine-hydrolysing)